MKQQKIAILTYFVFLVSISLVNIGAAREIEPNVYQSSISGSLFAIQNGKSSSSITIGDLSNNFRLQIESKGFLWDPEIIDGRILLFVESTRLPNAKFYLSQLRFSGKNIECQRLAVSNKFIGGPTNIDYEELKRIIFFTGEYDAESSGNNVTRRRLSQYQNGKVTIFTGSTFSTMNRINKMEEGTYLGASYSIEPPMPGYDESASINLTENSLLARIKISDDNVTAIPDTNGRLQIDAVSSVSAIPDSSVIVIKSTDFSKGYPAREKLTVVEKHNGKMLMSFLLPAGHLYGEPNLIPDIAIDGSPTIDLLSSNESGDVFMARFFNGELVKNINIDLFTSNAFSTESCTEDGIIDF